MTGEEGRVEKESGGVVRGGGGKDAYDCDGKFFEVYVQCCLHSSTSRDDASTL